MSTVTGFVPAPKYGAIEQGFVTAAGCVEHPGLKAMLKRQGTWPNSCVRCLLDNETPAFNLCPKANTSRSACRWHMLTLSLGVWRGQNTGIEQVIRATWILEGVPAMVKRGKPSKTYRARERRW